MLWTPEVHAELVKGEPAELRSKTRITAEQVLAIGLPDLTAAKIPTTDAELRMAEAELACAFALAGGVHALLPGVGATKLDERFDADGLRLRLRLPASMVGELDRRLRDLSRGAAVLTLHEADGG